MLVAHLPGDFAVPVLIVQHLSRESPSMLPQLLTNAGPLPAKHAEDGELPRSGRIYIAPPDLHMVMQDHHLHLRRGPRENNTRPAVDPLFRSAAVAHGAGTIGVILSGTLYDGTAGLQAIKAHGGVAIVQDPDEALFESMPRNALRRVAIDHCLPVKAIAERLVALARLKATHPAPRMSESDELEIRIAEGAPDSHAMLARIARPSPYSCPECHGTLWELRNPESLRFRCRVGHAYTAESLISLQDQEVEGSLWSAVRALEERAALARRMLERADQHGFATLKERFEERREESEHHAGVLRRLLLGGIDKDPQE